MAFKEVKKRYNVSMYPIEMSLARRLAHYRTKGSVSALFGQLIRKAEITLDEAVAFKESYNDPITSNQDGTDRTGTNE